MGSEEETTKSKISHEEIAECLRSAFYETFPPRDPLQKIALFSSIEKILNAYQTVKKDGIYGLLPKGPILQEIEEAIASIEINSQHLIRYQELRMDKDRKRNLSHEEWEQIQNKKEKQEKRVNRLIKDLRRFRQWARKLNYKKGHYSQRAAEAKGFVSWALWETLTEHEPDLIISKSRIYLAIYKLLRYGGIQKIELKGPEEAIRKRIEYFLKKMSPQKPSKILFHLLGKQLL